MKVSTDRITVRKILALFAVLMTVLLSACDDTFNPLQENDQYYFSIYGTLDASADTQWVRVMPVRDSILTSTEPLGAKVTLTKKSSGDVYTLQDSLFKLRDHYYAWNYWTDADIEPGEEYYFKATNKDGASSTAEVSVPKDFPTPIVDYGDEQVLARIFVDQVKHLVVSEIIYYFKVVERGVVKPNVYSESFSLKDDIREEGNGRKIIFGYPNDNFGELNKKYVTDFLGIKHIKQEVTVVSGGSDWPDERGLSEEERFLPGSISNIDHGLGVLVGIVSKRMPLKSCHDNQGNLIACPLVNSGNIHIVE